MSIVLKAGQNIAKPISLNNPIDIGDIYRAKSNSKAEITFVNRNILRIGQSSSVEIKEYMVQGDKSSGLTSTSAGSRP